MKKWIAFGIAVVFTVLAISLAWMRIGGNSSITYVHIAIPVILLLPVRFIATLCRQSKNLMQHRHEVFAVIGCSIEGEAGCGAGIYFVPYILPLPGSQSPNLSW